MLDSQARSAQDGETKTVEQAVSFRFFITWSTVFAPATAAKEEHTAKAIFAATTADEAPPKSTQSAVVQWEMVVPTLVRPSTGPSAEPRVQDAGTAGQPLPNLYPAPLLPRRGRNAWKPLAGAMLLAALVIPAWKYAVPAKPKSKAVEVETDTFGGGWARQSTADGEAGAKQARQLILYQPSLNATNGQFEFTWKVAEQGVGWIFRAKDSANYYAMHIKVLSRAPSLKLSVEHFTVHLGSEGSHSEKVLVFPRNEPALRVKLDVSGPSFTLYLQGNAVDYWNDTRLISGGFGFFEEWHQAAEVRAVRMSFPQLSASGGA